MVAMRDGVRVWRPTFIGPREPARHFRRSSSARPTTSRRRAVRKSAAADPKPQACAGSRRAVFRRGPAMPSPTRIAAAAIVRKASFTKYLSRGRGRMRAAHPGWSRGTGAAGGSRRWACPLCRACAELALGCLRAARARRKAISPDCGRFLERRISQRHLPRRRVRPEAGDLGLPQRARRCPRSGGEGGARGRGHRALDGADAVAARRFAPAGRARLRGLPVRAMVARHLRRVLAAAGDLRGGLLPDRYSDVPMVHLYRAGTTPMRAPRWRTTPAWPARSAGRFA